MSIVFRRHQKNIRVPQIVLSRNDNQGFIALITSIILSVILITVAVALSQTGFLARAGILESEYKDKSKALAEACVDAALLKFAQDFSYIGNESGIVVGTDTCDIGIVSVSGNEITINTEAEFPSYLGVGQRAVTKLQIVADKDSFTAISWEEVI